jgi:hypothetical protein
MLGRSLADAFARVDSAEELGDVLLVHDLPGFVTRLRLDDEGGAVRARQHRDWRRARHDTRARLERPVQQHVLLVVDDEPAGVVRRDGLRRGCDRLPDGHDREDRPSRDVVGRLGVGPHGRLGHLVRVRAPHATDRTEVEARGARSGHGISGYLISGSFSRPLDISYRLP